MSQEQTRRVDLPMQTRFASLQSVDQNARTVELVWTTGARVMRRDMWTGERYAEDLSLEKGHVDLTRLNNGAPLLNSHGQYDLRDVIGVVERAWIDGGEGRALVRFSERDDVAPIWRDVQSGIIRNVSVGYQIRKIEVDKKSEEFPVYRAVDWEPMEISLVPVPADAGAGTRAAELAVNPCIIEEARADAQGEQMTERHDAGVEPVVEVTETETRAAAPAVDVEAIRAAERTRAAEINALAARHQIPADVAARAIEDGTDAAAFRAVVLDTLAARSEATVINSRHNDTTIDNPLAKRSALEGALVARVQGRAPEGNAQAFAGIGFIDLARELTGMQRGTPSQIVERAMAQNSDFPIILANAGNKILLDTYNTALPTYRQWTTKNDFNDFKSHSFAGLGDFPDLATKTETGDYSEGTVGEKGESITAAEYGVIYHVSRKLLINDDLGAFNRMAAMAAVRAAAKENALVYAKLAANPTLADTVALFHATHANIDSVGAAISVTSLSTAKAAMQKQTSVNGLKLNITPRYLVVGPDIETAARQVVSPIAPSQVSNVNPFSGMLEVIVDANVAGNDWYLFADPTLAPVMSYGYVSGGAGPTFATDERFESGSMRFRLQLDFGAGPVDYRGGYYNVGA